MTRDQGKAWWTVVRDNDQQRLERDLKGLKVRYNRPDGGKREWRFNKFVKCAAEMQMEQEDQDGKRTRMTIREYFLKVD